MVQIIVYAGAIMVLFLFVIMLLGVDRTSSLTERIKCAAVARGASSALGLIAEVAVVVHLGIGLSNGGVPDFAKANAGGNVRALAAVLFNRYFFPFEVTSVLLIVAAIGAMLHGRRPIDPARSSTPERQPTPRHGTGRRQNPRGAARPVRTPIGAYLLLSGGPVHDRHASAS